ncbi:MAG TPA: hypothetical protein PKD64_18375 [Pirellulaceae bacterium]|nr:hypothetical protein [Pirellulaceae bacterium]HMO94156.1 hypothetical protein [Pirellulaceae bacterium]HMP71171.1 hypothetical protein [Pirellulaceae bacterium]
MALHERQQFDFLLQTAVERFVERLEQRFRGAHSALEELKCNPEAEGIWLSQFTGAVFDDFLLNNVEGACFVLRSLPQRRVNLEATVCGTVEQHLIELSQTLFRELLRNKSKELLEQHVGYQAVTSEG